MDEEFVVNILGFLLGICVSVAIAGLVIYWLGAIGLLLIVPITLCVGLIDVFIMEIVIKKLHKNDNQTSD